MQKNGPCCLPCGPTLQRTKSGKVRERGPITPAVLDELLMKMERTLAKVDSARGKVKVQRVETDLLGLFEDARDIMQASLVEDPSDRDRTKLMALFGGDCARIARIRAVLDAASFSTKGTVEDKRTAMCSNACKSVEDVLQDLGHARALKNAIGQSRDAVVCRRMDDARDAVNKVLSELEVGDALQLTRSASGLASGASDPSPPCDPQRAQVVDTISSGAHKEVALRIFAVLDIQRTGTLDWNSGRIRNFITQVFQQLEILKLPEEAQMYAMYCKFDTGGKWGLNSGDCIKLIEDLCRSLYGIEDDSQRARALSAINSGQLAGVVEKKFQAIDSSELGTITWNSGDVRRLVVEVFQAFELPVVSEHYIFAMCAAFDVDGERSLGLRECKRLAEALFRSLDQVSTAGVAIDKSGHEMHLFVTQAAGTFCNICEKPFGAKIALWQSKSGDFYMCVRCDKEGRKRLAGR